MPQSILNRELTWGSVAIRPSTLGKKVSIQIDAPHGAVSGSLNTLPKQTTDAVPATKASSSLSFFYAVPSGATLRINNVKTKLRAINPAIDQIVASYYQTSDSSLVQAQYKSVLEAGDLIDANPLSVEGYVWFRGYRLACIKVAPYFKQSGSVVALESVEAELQVQNSSEPSITRPSVNDKHFEDVLKNVITNYEEVKSFPMTPLVWNDTTGNWFTPGMTALKLGIPQDGIFRITYEDLQTAGVPVNQPNTFRLLNRGKEIPIFVHLDTNMVFSSEGYIEFVGRRNYGLKDYRTIATGKEEYAEYLNRYTDTSVYWLVWGGADGQRVSTNSGTPVVSDTLDWYTEVVHLETNNFIQYIDVANNLITLDPRWLPSDVWGWGWLNGGGTFNADFLAENISSKYPTANIYARFASWGGQNYTPTHRLRLRVNASDTLQGLDLQLYQQVLMPATAPITDLKSGTNTIRLHSLPTASSPNQLLIDWFDVEYPRTLTTSDSLIFSFRMIDSTKVRGISITGLSTQNVILYKMSPTPKHITDITFTGTTSFSMLFFDTIAIGDTYVLLSAEKIKKPVIQGTRQMGNLRNTNQQADYLLITHKRFWNTAKNSYMPYIGSKYNLTTMAIDVDDIYDQFGYGYPTAESIREFIKSTTQWTQQSFPAYLFIVGDGTYDYKYVLADPNPLNRPFNAVPVYGQPVSDPYLTVVEDADTLALPQMYVGRVPANTDAEFQKYFARVQKFLSEKNDDWNKRYIFFAGGDPNTTGQVEGFKAVNESIINTYIAPNPVAGIAASFYKTANPQSDYGPYSPEYIRDVIDNGAVFISYIGHSGTQTWDNGIGDPIQLQNKRGKYGLITDFGCSTAKFAESNIKCFGELFILSDAGSAIAYIGNSALGFTSFAMSLPPSFYRELLWNNMCKIGQAHYLAKLDQILSSGGYASGYNRIMMYTNTLLGDPTLELPIPQKPNLSLHSADITSSPSPITNDDQYANIVIPYWNTGKVTQDTVTTKFSISYLSETSDTTLRHQVPRFQDTLFVRLPIEQRNGDFQLSVQLNSDRQVQEIDYSDNEAIAHLSVLSSSFKQIVPLPNFEQQVVGLTLLNPSTRSSDGSSTVELEVDTNESISNPQKYNQTLGRVVTKFSLPALEEGTRYYWRAGLMNSNKPKSQGSFVVGATAQTRWRQSDSISWRNADFIDAEYVQGKGVMVKEKQITLRLISKGRIAGQFGAVEINGYNVLPNSYARGHAIVILDTVNITAQEVRQFDNSNSSSSAWSDSLVAYIGRIPTGTMVLDVIIFEGSLNFTQAARNALKTIGASTYVNSIQDGDSYAIIGRKGAISGTVQEVYKPKWPGESAIIDTFFIRKPQQCTVVSPAIGPVGSWDTVWVNRSLPIGSTMMTSIIGIHANGGEDTIVANSQDSILPITNVSVMTYPKIKLSAQLIANSNLESPSLSEWSVTAEAPAELAINYQSVTATTDSILEGEPVSISVDVYNIGAQSVDSVFVALKELRHDLAIDTLFIPSIPKDTSRRVTFIYSTVSRRGNNILQVEIDPKQRINELYKTNNTYSFPLFVRTDTVQPSFDITFDGQRIYDGDYVLPNPTIKIAIYDNSPLPIHDPSLVFLTLDDQRITLGTDPDSLFESKSGPEKAVVTFKPKLKGRRDPYKLMVEVQDSTGNRVALPAPLYFSIDSLLSFKNVFNYPNPFASETHFTFVLTDYADEVEIKIYTINGRLIQDIQVPPQSNAYYRVYWNGRDHDGDDIANGIYFYKVIAKSNGSVTEIIQKLAKVR
jgi:hypothetical protein